MTDSRNTTGAPPLGALLAEAARATSGPAAGTGRSTNDGVVVEVGSDSAVTVTIQPTLIPRESDRDRVAQAVAEAVHSYLASSRGDDAAPTELASQMLRESETLFADGRRVIEDRLAAAQDLIARMRSQSLSGR